MNALAHLVERGLTVTADGCEFVVKPTSRLNDEIRAFIRERTRLLVALAGPWSQLERAIRECCDQRGDSAENRAALLADCVKEPVTDWPWLTQYFRSEDARRAH